MCLEPNAHFSYTVQSLQTRKWSCSLFGEAFTSTKVSKTVTSTQVYRPTWSRQSLIESLFPGKSRLYLTGNYTNRSNNHTLCLRWFLSQFGFSITYVFYSIRFKHVCVYPSYLYHWNHQPTKVRVSHQLPYPVTAGLRQLQGKASLCMREKMCPPGHHCSLHFLLALHISLLFAFLLMMDKQYS